MEYLLLGFFTGLSLILAIGAQNIFVIEQGLKKQHIFLVCFICSVSDLVLIFTGVFLFHFFSQYFNPIIELIFNVALIFFLIHFIYTKVKSHYKKINFNKDLKNISALNISFKTLAFTYLNPHVYSDTVFFLGNFSKNFLFNQKILFGIGASITSFIFFYSIGYLSKYLSKYTQSHKMWKIINIFIITLMSLLILYIIVDIFS
jgi:L-lysine exporter family protein LysE/ArgO